MSQLHMFSSKANLIKRSGKKGVDRPQFIQELVQEFYSKENLGKSIICFYLAVSLVYSSTSLFQFVSVLEIIFFQAANVFRVLFRKCILGVCVIFVRFRSVLEGLNVINPFKLLSYK